MQIRKIFDLNGPNIWTNAPAIEAWVDLGHFEELPTNKLPGFTERLMGYLPTLIEHRCSIGERGGFLQRLQTGTWLGHVLEHVTLEVQSLAHEPVGFGRAREMPEYGVYKVVVACESPRFGEACLRSMRDFLLAVVDDRPFDLDAEIKRLKVLGTKHCLGPGTRAIVEAARKRGIPALRLTDGNLVQLGYGNRQRRIWTAETDRTSAVAEEIAQDKDLTRRLLAASGVPVPAGRAVKDEDDAWIAAQELGEPVVVKPIDGNHGRAVSIRLDTEAAIREAFALAAKEGSGVIVERFIPGSQHRVLVVGEQVVASVAGEADVLTGDGSSSIRQLIDRANADPRRGDGQSWILTQIELGPIVLEQLRRQSFTPESIPAAGQEVLIQHHGDLTVDETDRIHPEVAAMCVLAAQTVGLDIAGLDVVTSDIGVPLAEASGAVIEVNASPGLLAHLKPLIGKPRPVGEAIVGQLFKEGERGVVPIVAVSGARASAPTAQLMAQLLRLEGHSVARADSSGLYLGERLLRRGNATDAQGARQALMNPGASAVVIETDAQKVLEEGIAFDVCQIAIITSTAGAESLARPGVEDRAHVDKAIRCALDVVPAEGFAVLNAQDPQAPEMASKCKGGVVWFGVEAGDSPLVQHLAAGGAALVRSGNRLAWWNRGEKLAALAVSNLTESTDLATVEPLMAALAAALALGVSRSLLETFLSNFQH